MADLNAQIDAKSTDAADIGAAALGNEALVDAAVLAAAPVVDPAAVADGVEVTAASTAAAASQAAVKAADAVEADTKWYADLPEEMHEKLGSFTSVEDAMDAIDKGAKYTQAKSTDDYKLDLGINAEGVDMNTVEDGGVLNQYKEFCLKQGIAPEQAQEQLTWQTKRLAEARTQLIEQGTAELKDRWGSNMEPNRTKGFETLAALDRMMDGRLAPAMKANGALNDPMFIEALYVIGQSIGEDSLGRQRPGGAEPEPLSTKDAYQKLMDDAGPQ